MVLSGDHTLLGGRIAPLTENKLALRLSGPSDFGLVGIPARSVPADLPSGRVYKAGTGLQAQSTCSRATRRAPRRPPRSSDALRAPLAPGGPVVVLIDDAEMLRECGAGAELTALVRRQYGEDVGLVLAGDSDSICSGFSGWQVEAKKARRGLLSSPQNVTDAELIGTRLPRAVLGRPVPPRQWSHAPGRQRARRGSGAARGRGPLTRPLG